MSTLTSTLEAEASDALATLSQANLRQARLFPGDKPNRQPVHTVYGGAHLYKSDTTLKLGDLALRSLRDFAPDAAAFATALRLPGHEALSRSFDEHRLSFERDERALWASNPEVWLPLAVHTRVLAKLKREAVEDFRIDFEDGFGVRPDTEEDEAAVRAAEEVARGMKAGTVSPFIGIRIKTFNEENIRRSVRTLDLFVSTLVKSAGALPENFVVTLPKITVAEQPRTLVRLFERLEARLALAPGSLKMEMMVELTQSIFDAQGRIALPLLLEACEGRCTAAHFGTYDYTASCDITAAYQGMDHPVCQYALHTMKNAFAGTGLCLSDGATSILPVGPHRTPAGGALTPEQTSQNLESIHAAWRLAYENIRSSLRNGIYQGWDLHPGQLPIRYAACYAFFLEGFTPAADRLRNFIDKAAQATLIGDVFDDAATGQGLLNYFLRGLSSGAVSVAELSTTGLTESEVRSRSFLRIIAGRTQGR